MIMLVKFRRHFTKHLGNAPNFCEMFRKAANSEVGAVPLVDLEKYSKKKNDLQQSVLIQPRRDLSKYIRTTDPRPTLGQIEPYERAWNAVSTSAGARLHLVRLHRPWQRRLDLG